MRSVLLTTTFMVALMSSSYAKVIDRIVAVVNDDVVTLSELQDGLKVRLAAVDGITNPEEKARQTKIIMSRGLDDMIGKRLIRQEAAKRKIKVDQDAVDQHLARVQAAQRWTDDQMNMYLAAQGLTRDDFKKEVRFQMLEQRVIGMVLGQKVRISERDLKDYYQETMTERTQEYEVDAAHIVVRVTTGASPADEAKARTTAMAILKRAQDGEDFGALARETSQAPGAENGGDLGTLQRVTFTNLLKMQFSQWKQARSMDLSGAPSATMWLGSSSTLCQHRATRREGDLRSELHRKKIRDEVGGWVEELRAKSFVDIRL